MESSEATMFPLISNHAHTLIIATTTDKRKNLLYLDKTEEFTTSKILSCVVELKVIKSSNNRV